MYVVLNEKRRDAFEKKYQMPYGYGNSIKITDDYEEALDWVRCCPNEFVIEEYSPIWGRSVIFRHG